MSLVIAGRIVPMTLNSTVADGERASFRGCVCIRDDGTIASVLKSRQKLSAEFEGARKIDVGTSLVLPGFVDLHSHLAYAALPLWVEVGRLVPFQHHDSWPTRPTYAAEVTWPAYAFVTASPAELLAYAEVRALIGGTTSIQGSPPSNRPLDGWLVRNVEDETLGKTLPRTRIQASTLTLDATQLASRANNMRAGSSFIYHCAEGRHGSVVAREFESLRTTGCLQSALVAIHTNALGADAYDAWGQPGAVVWSPFSNLWLYGETTNVPAVIARDIKVCIGSDWGPSGTRNVLGELKVAALVSQSSGWGLADFELVKMITANPGDALTAAWGRQVGRLQPNALADIVVIHSERATADPFKAIVDASEMDVDLVIVGGRPVCGTPGLMAGAGATATSRLDVGAERRTLALTRFDTGGAWSFAEVLARMEEVRADPKGQIESARALAMAGRLRGEPPPFRLALDMPTGRAPVGGLPRDLSQIVVPPVQPIEHDAAFFASLTGRGFHAGLLDGLKAYYA